MTDEPIQESEPAPKREVLTIYVAEAEDGIRLDRWFRRRWPHLSNIQVQKMARSGQIRVDGARIKPEGRLTAGAAVRVPPIPDDTSRQAGDAHKLSERDIAFAKSLVLYEDDMVIAINKPHGLAVQGGTKTSRHVDRLLSAWGEGMYRPRLVH
ncbi:MAG: RluA family pseudouridine synthase, partial [Brevundimonas sp.]|nr:RluA family pseudouridine synthase [Brevundimonas sp.]